MRRERLATLLFVVVNLGWGYALPNVVAPRTSAVVDQGWEEDEVVRGEGDGFGVRNGIPPKPTPPPKVREGLRRRENALLGKGAAIDVDDNVCGWINADPDNAFSCIEPHATCLWDTEKKVVGCGTGRQMPFVTSCIEYASADSCDAACKANPSNVICGKSSPFCQTVHFPSSYSMLPCGSTGTPLIVNFTVVGLEGTITELPRFATASPTDVPPDGTAGIAGDPTSHEGVNTGSIIAAAIGGAVLLAGLPFGIKMLLQKRKWSKAQRPRRQQEREMRRAWAGPEERQRDIYVRQEIPRAGAGTTNFLFSQDWPGKAKLPASGAT